MARRLPERSTPPPAASGVLVLPPELTFNRPEHGWVSDVAFHAAQRQWLVEHGIDPGDWSAVHPILCASKRAHARTKYELCSLDRLRVTADPESAAEWWPPSAHGD